MNDFAKAVALLACVAIPVLAGCEDSGGCFSRAGEQCIEGTTYWMDSCGNPGEIKEQCECGCAADHSGCRRCNCTCPDLNECCDGCVPVYEGEVCDDQDPDTVTDVCREGVCAGWDPADIARPAAPDPIRLQSWACPPGWSRVGHDSLVDENGDPFFWCEPPPPPRLKAGDYTTPLGEGESQGDRPVCDPEVDGTFPVLGSGACQPLGDSCPAGEWPAVPPEVTGARIYAKAGAAGGDGTPESPYGTIGAAVDVAAAGDVIVVGAGTYPESLSILKDLTIWGSCVRQSVVDAPGPHAGSDAGAIVVGGDAEVVIHNLRISGAQCGLRVDSAQARVSLQGVWIHRCTRYGVFISGGVLDVSGLLVDSTLPDPDGNIGRGLAAGSGSEVNMASTIFEGNRMAGVVASDQGTVMSLGDLIIRETRCQEIDGAYGWGLRVSDGAQVTLERGLVEKNRLAGILASNPGTIVDLQEVSVLDTVGQELDSRAVGLIAQQGAQVTLSRGVIRRNRNFGIEVLATGTVVTLTDVVVQDTRSQEDLLQWGWGLEVNSGARAVCTRGLFEGNRDIGVVATGAGTEVSLEDVAVVDTQSEESTGKFGQGLVADFGAQVDVTRGLFEGNREAGIEVREAFVSLADVIVRGTLSEEATAKYGLGLHVHPGSRVELVRGAVERNREAGIWASGADTVVDLQDLTVRDTQAQEVSGLFGRGLEAYSGARVELTRGLFEGNRQVSVMAMGAGTYLSLQDLTVRETRSQDADLTLGRGMQVSDGAGLALIRGLFERNREVGIAVFHRGPGLSLEHVSIRETLKPECASLPSADPRNCEERSAAANLGVYLDACVDFAGLQIAGSATIGIQLSRRGTITGRGLEIRSNPIGVNIQEVPEEYDFFESVTGLRMGDNQTNFDSTALPVPDPVVGLE